MQASITVQPLLMATCFIVPTCGLPAAQGAMWVYESVVSPTLKQVSQEARKVPALQKALDKLDAFTVRGSGLFRV